MALQVLAGPGCSELGKDEYVSSRLRRGDVVIDTGRIYAALTGDGSIPSSNLPALRLARGLRTTAIRRARENELSGFVLTSSGSRRDLDRLVAETGSPGIAVLAMTEAQACARLSALVPAGERREACTTGIRGRWFERYQPESNDREVTL